MAIMSYESTFLDALKRQNKGSLPVWFMRQAGRYLPEYMAVKEKSSFHEMSHDPEQMAEVTIQPLRRYPLDAAIMFSDILTCLEYMGAPFSFAGGGPKLANSGAETLFGLSELDPEKDMMYVREGIKKIKSELGERPMIGFVGAPFTLASYLVEGGTSREFNNTRKLMYSEPEKFQKALHHLGQQVGNYLKFQIESGANAVQIFDSWVGILPTYQYEKFVLPVMQEMIALVKPAGVPIILYSQPTRHILPYLAETGADALSVDWRTPLHEVSADLTKLGKTDLCLQGNLDPIATTLNWDQAKPYVQGILDSARKAKILDRFIFNVGHGVTPQTNIETLVNTVELVHGFKG